MQYSKPVSEIIAGRYSCRTYLDERISETDRSSIEDFLSSLERGPFGIDTRFRYIPAGDEEKSSGGRLGTYGFIKNASGFIAGAVGPGGMGLEEYGFQMERIVLYVSGLDVGTCWLGGTFSRGSFSERLALADRELLPAVVSVGYPAERPRVRDSIVRFAAGSDKRAPWGDLFFDGDFGRPLSADSAGAFAMPLEMLRLAPSASNRQPWRVVKEEGRDVYHWYLQRTKGYYEKNRSLFGMQDLQRVDMGIGMAHFAAGAAESGLRGAWKVLDPGIGIPPELCQYVVTWIGAR